jgi:hypothetical protein
MVVAGNHEHIVAQSAAKANRFCGDSQLSAWLAQGLLTEATLSLPRLPPLTSSANGEHNEMIRSVRLDARLAS